MSHTISLVRNGTLGDRKTARALVTMVSYPTGGEALTAAELGLVYVEELVVVGPNEAGIDARFKESTIGTSPTFLLYDEDNTSGVAAELANGAYTGVVRVLAIGF